MFDIDNKKASQVVQGLQIPAKPELLSQLQEEQRRGCADLNRVAEIISSDVGLAANVMKAINSPVFGLSRTITDIKQSVMLLGFQNVMNLVTYYEMRHVIAGDASISLERFWDSAADTARMMVVVLNRLELKRDCPIEDAYALGLFHNCGLAMMAMRFKDYCEVLQEANAAYGVELTSIEEKYYNTNHAIVGYYVASSWNLPKRLCDLILRHHEAEMLDDENMDESIKDLFGILKLASNILSRYRRGNEHNEWDAVKGRVLYQFSISEEDYQEIEADIIDEFEMA